MIEIFFIASYVASVFFLPWWVSAILAIILIAYYQKYFFVLCGALVLDSLYGTPLNTFLGATHLYTLLFALLIAVDMVFRGQLLD